jgi:hypothetical protein
MGACHVATVDSPSTAKIFIRPALTDCDPAPARVIPQIALEGETSDHDKDFPNAVISASSSTLRELAHLLRLQAHQREQHRRRGLKVYRCQVSTALSGRLSRCGQLAHRTLVDELRFDNSRGFANLFDAVQDVRESCDATRRFALLDGELGFGDTQRDPSLPVQETGGTATSTFMHGLPPKTRRELLAFLSKLRTDPDFLADRIGSLSKDELTSLTAFHQFLDPADSVISSSSRGKAHPPLSTRNADYLPGPVERLLSFQRHDPLAALLSTIFADSSGPHSSEDRRRTDVWSSACVRLITEGRSGGEHFLRIVLNAWASMRDWPWKDRLELYLMDVLQEGASLLERTEEISPSSRPLLKPPASKRTISADQFYDLAVLRLFETLDHDANAGGIPEGVVELANAILTKMEGLKKHRTAQTFIVSKWFFSTFLMNAIIYPEVSLEALQQRLSSIADCS